MTFICSIIGLSLATFHYPLRCWVFFVDCLPQQAPVCHTILSDLDSLRVNVLWSVHFQINSVRLFRRRPNITKHKWNFISVPHVVKRKTIKKQTLGGKRKQSLLYLSMVFGGYYCTEVAVRFDFCQPGVLIAFPLFGFASRKVGWQGNWVKEEKQQQMEMKADEEGIKDEQILAPLELSGSTCFVLVCRTGWREPRGQWCRHFEMALTAMVHRCRCNLHSNLLKPLAPHLRDTFTE